MCLRSFSWLRIERETKLDLTQCLLTLITFSIDLLKFSRANVLKGEYYLTKVTVKSLLKSTRVTLNSFYFESLVSPPETRMWPMRIENTEFWNTIPLSYDFCSLEQLIFCVSGSSFFKLEACHRKLFLGTFVFLEPWYRTLEDRIPWFIFNYNLLFVRRWFSQWSLRGHTAVIWNFRSHWKRTWTLYQ